MESVRFKNDTITIAKSSDGVQSPENISEQAAEVVQHSNEVIPNEYEYNKLYLDTRGITVNSSLFESSNMNFPSSFRSNTGQDNFSYENTENEVSESLAHPSDLTAR